MTPEQLRTSVLQYALSGKLVPQIVEEGSAEDLIKENKRIREQYIEANKIKKSKPLEEISDSEIPYEIPENWKWVRIGDFCIDVFSGKSPKYSKTPTEYRIIGQAANQQEGLCYEQIKYTDANFWSDMSERYFVKEYDVLLNTLGNGTLGRSGIVKVLPHKLLTDGHLFVFRFTEHTEAMFLYYYLQYKRTEIERSANGSTNQTFLSLGNTLAWIIPVPPLAEQHRIVAKIEELLPFVDRYAEAYSKLEQFNAKFPEDMKKSILQYAIQGKLVEQRAEEGTAEELYQKIQEEKQRLIKEGKIKKEKPLAATTEEEIPFDIPETWKWVRLTELLVEKPTNGYSPRSVAYVTNYKNLTLTATTSGYFKYDAFKYVDITNEEANKYWLKKNDLLIQRSNSRELVGTSCVYEGEDDIYIYPDLMMRLHVMPNISVKYIDYVLKSPYVRMFYSKNATGTSESMPKINQSIVASTLIPLPPIAEQKRIIEKTEELLIFCERLVK